MAVVARPPSADDNNQWPTTSTTEGAGADLQHPALRHVQDLSRLTNKVLLKRTQLEHGQQTLMSCLKFLRESTDALMAALTEPKPSKTRRKRLKQLQARYHQDYDAVDKQETELASLRAQLNNLEYLLGGKERSLANILKHVIADPALFSEIPYDLDEQPFSASHATSGTETPTLLQEYFDKKGDAGIFHECLVELEINYYDGLATRELIADRGDVLELSDEQFQGDYERKRKEIERDIEAAEAAAEEFKRLCHEAGISTVISRRSHSSEESAQSLADQVRIPSRPASTTSQQSYLRTWLDGVEPGGDEETDPETSALALNTPEPLETPPHTQPSHMPDNNFGVTTSEAKVPTESWQNSFGITVVFHLHRRLLRRHHNLLLLIAKETREMENYQDKRRWTEESIRAVLEALAPQSEPTITQASRASFDGLEVRLHEDADALAAQHKTAMELEAQVGALSYDITQIQSQLMSALADVVRCLPGGKALLDDQNATLQAPSIAQSNSSHHIPDQAQDYFDKLGQASITQQEIFSLEEEHALSLRQREFERDQEKEPSIPDEQFAQNYVNSRNNLISRLNSAVEDALRLKEICESQGLDLERLRYRPSSINSRTPDREVLPWMAAALSGAQSAEGSNGPREDKLDDWLSGLPNPSRRPLRRALSENDVLRTGKLA